MDSPDHALILWTLIVTAVSTGLALTTVVIAFFTAKYGRSAWLAAAEAVKPLEQTVVGLKELARIQCDTIDAARVVQQVDRLSRELDACGMVLDALLAMSTIESRSVSRDDADEEQGRLRRDTRFLTSKAQLLSALYRLPEKVLPKAHRLSVRQDFDAAGDLIAEAQRESAALVRDLQAKVSAVETGAPS